MKNHYIFLIAYYILLSKIQYNYASLAVDQCIKLETTEQQLDNQTEDIIIYEPVANPTSLPIALIDKQSLDEDQSYNEQNDDYFIIAPRSPDAPLQQSSPPSPEAWSPEVTTEQDIQAISITDNILKSTQELFLKAQGIQSPIKSIIDSAKSTWYTIAALLSSDSIEYALSFQKTLQENFSKVDLAENTPAEVALKFQSIEHVTQDQAQFTFESLSLAYDIFKKSKSHSLDNVKSRFTYIKNHILTMYNQLNALGIINESQETISHREIVFNRFEELLNQGDLVSTEQLKAEITAYLENGFKIIRQSYYFLREPIQLELYKAYRTNGLDALIQKIDYLKSAFSSKNITAEFAQECMNAIISTSMLDDQETNKTFTDFIQNPSTQHILFQQVEQQSSSSIMQRLINRFWPAKKH